MQPSLSKIYPGSQWITNVMKIEVRGAILNICEEQSFGEDEDLKTKIEELTIPIHNSRTVVKGTVTVVRYNRQSIVVTHSTADRSLSFVIRYIRTGPRTLLRKTVATQVDKARKFVVGDELEVFQRD